MAAGSDHLTVFAGLPIPSKSPLFLTLIGLHVLLGVLCVIAGAIAILSRKGRGRHSRFGTIYFWGLAAVVLSAGVLAAMRWSEDYDLFVLGGLAFASAFIGRTAMRRRWSGWLRIHIAGLGYSYVVLLTAFYVDNGKNLPLWRHLPPIAFWLLPSALGIPIIAYQLLRHRLVREAGAASREGV